MMIRLTVSKFLEFFNIRSIFDNEKTPSLTSNSVSDIYKKQNKDIKLTLKFCIMMIVKRTFYRVVV